MRPASGIEPLLQLSRITHTIQPVPGGQHSPQQGRPVRIPALGQQLIRGSDLLLGVIDDVEGRVALAQRVKTLPKTVGGVRRRPGGEKLRAAGVFAAPLSPWQMAQYCL